MTPQQSQLVSLSQLLLIACDQSYAGEQLVPGESALFRLDDAPLYGQFQPPFESYYPDYVVAFAREDSRSGFKYVIYQNETTREIVVAMAGTDGTDLRDWWSDLIHYGWNQWSRNRVQVLQDIDALVGRLQEPGETDPEIHFTGQSLGGAVAQYAAYEFVETHGAYPKSQLSLVTFNSLGGVAALRDELPRRIDSGPITEFPQLTNSQLNASLVSGFGSVAHYGSLNDLVWQAGGGHLGGNVYSFAGLDFGNVNPLTNEPFLLDTISAHRIESGFYYPLTQFSQAEVSAFAVSVSGGPLSQAQTSQSYLRVDKLQKLVSMMGNLFRQSETTAGGAMVKLLFGGLGGVTLGDSAQINELVRAYVDTRHAAGKYQGKEDDYQAAKNTDWAFRLRVGALALGVPVGGVFTPFGLVVKLAGAIALAPVYRLLEGISNDDGEFALRTTFQLQREGPRVPEGTFEESLQRSTLIGSALGATPTSGRGPDLDAVAELTSFDVDGFAQAMVSGGPAWYRNTAKYLSARANLLGKQQKAQEALNEFWSYSRQAADGNPTLLANISEQFIESTTEWKNAVADVNGELAAPRDASTQISGLDTYAKKRTFWDSVITGLDAALNLFVGTAHASETRTAAENAIADVKAAAQTLVIRPGTSRNPFDNSSFEPSDSVPTGGLKESQVATYTAYLPYEAGSRGQRISLKLAGTSASKLRVLDRADEIAPGADGSFVLTVPEGAREVSFGLWAKEDVDANDTLTLSATLTDSAGVATHKTHTELVLTLNAVDEADAGVVQVVDGTALANVIDTAGLTGENPIPGLDPQRTSVLNGAGGGDHIAGGPRADTFNGGEGADWMFSYGVYDGDFQPLADADAEALRGEAGNDLVQAVRSAARLEGGDGDDVLDATKVSTLNLANASWLDLGDRFSVRAGAAFLDPTGHQAFGYEMDFGAEDFSGISRWTGGGSTTFTYRAADKTYVLQASGDPTPTEIALTRFDTPYAGIASVSLYGGAGNDIAIGNNGADFISGDAGDDRLAGNAGEDALYGGAGADRIAGGSGADLAQGGDGADVIMGEDGNDALYGGAGDDEIQGDSVPLAGAFAGDDFIDGGDGNDLLFGQGGSDTLRGGVGNDIMEGDSAETPLAFQGADTLDGGAGDDELYGRGGDDRLYGGEGKDTLSGGAGKDLLEGGAGNDLIGGFEGDDALFGGAGDDELQGNEGNDSLAGGEGADILFGQEGSDQLFGGGGADQLYAGEGDDSLSGDEGNDTLLGEAGGDAIRAGGGDDVAQGGEGDDQIFGDEGVDVLYGDAGSDTLSGGAGNDFLIGGADADRYLIEFGGGADVIQDREGLSTIAFGSGIGVGDLALFSGTDEAGRSYLVVEISSADSVAIEGALEGDNERYVFADGTALTREQLMDQARRRGFHRTGTADADQVEGDLGDDELEGGAGADVLRAGIGDDVYVFNLGDGADVIDDAGGSDTVRFGDGIEAASVTAAAGFDFFAGADVLTVGYGNLGDIIQIRDGVVGGIERFEFADGTLLSRAEVLNRALTPLTVAGTEGEDDLAGGGSQDMLFGFGGADRLAGQDGDDILNGGEGDDTLIGGAGNDTLAGDNGDDTYVFAPGAGADLINDRYGANRLRFEGVDYDSLSVAIASDRFGTPYLILNYGADAVGVAEGLTGGFDAVTFAGPGGEVVIGRRALLADKIEAPLTFTALDDQAVDMSGGRFDDAIAGSNRTDLIEGAGGNDSLAGRQGDDILRGGTGNDFLNGNEGLDSLEGGAGDDSYAIGAGMGFDVVVDAEGVSTLWLLPGTSDAGFVAQASGNDLVLTLRNSSEGARLTDYYSDPSRWRVRKTDGATQDLSSWLAALPPAPPTETVANWEAIYRERVAATLTSNWTREGYDLRADGLYHRDDVNEIQFSRSESHRTRSIKEVTQVAGADAHRSTAPLEQTGTSSTTTQVIQYPRHDLAGATFYPHGQISSAQYLDLNAGGISGISVPPGSATVQVQGPNTRDPHTGEIGPSIAGVWIYPPAPGGGTAVAQPVMQTTTRFNHVSIVDQKYVIEKIQSGASDSHISGFTYTLIDAGDGDDGITGAGAFNSYYGPGMFLYGNAGNDTIAGSMMDDIIVGGSGNDTLDGAFGSDEYVLFPDDGADYVRDTGRIPGFGYVPGELSGGQPLPAPGVDTLVLPAGVTAADLNFSWDTALAENDYVELERHDLFWSRPIVQSVYSFLTLSWGSQSVRVFVPHADDLPGEGIEQARFADGTTVQLLSLAPAHDTNPHQQDNVLSGVSGLVWGAGGNDTISGNGTLNGGEGDDILVADDNRAVLLGGKGADTFVGGAANDQLGEESGLEFFGAPNSYHGGPGNDRLFGTIGPDTIYYDVGDGVDTFDDYYRFLDRGNQPSFDPYVDIAYGGPVFGNNQSDRYYDYAGIETESIFDPAARVYRGQDKIVFGPGVTPEMISLGLGSLFIRVGDGGIHVEGFDRNDPYKPSSLGSLEFADGGTVSYSQLIDRGFDHSGSEFDDFFSGTGTVDRFAGGAGSDFYYFGYGTGRDSIREAASSADHDTLHVAGAWSEVQVRREGDDIVIQRRATPADRVALLDWYARPDARIEQVNFDDGTFWDAAMLESRVGMIVNEAPQLVSPIADQALSEGEVMALALNGVFIDTDPGDSMTFWATLADGSPLPEWLTIANGQLEAKPGGHDAGTFQIRLIATDASGATASDEFELIVADANLAPVLIEAPADVQAQENSELVVALPAGLFVDHDAGDSFVVAARLEDGSALPHWLAFDAAALTLSGTPRNQDVGEIRVRLLAVDQAGAVGSASLTIAVENANDAPLAAFLLADQSAQAGSAFEYVVPDNAFVDPDVEDGLALSVALAGGAPLPGWLSFDAAQRRFAGTPPGGGALEIVVIATDGGGASASDSFILTVEGGADSPPVLVQPLEDRSAQEDVPVTYIVPEDAFSDPDGDALSYVAENLPAWLSFDPDSRTFSGTPLNADVGSYPVQVIATDAGGLSASDELVVNVANVNDAPVVAQALPGRAFDAGSPFVFAVPAQAFADEDAGDSLALSASLFGGAPLPTWLSFDPASGAFTGNPRAKNIGISHIAVTATDAAGVSATADFGLIVRSAVDATATGKGGDDFLYGNSGDETLKAKGGSDYLYGDAGDDVLRGGTGNDVLQGGDGKDVLRGGTGQNVLDGGAGDDVIYGGQGSSFIAGGAGNDVLHVGRGNDVIAFNLGDGIDTVYGGRDGGNTLSFGGGIGYDDLSLSKRGKDLVVNVGTADKVVLKNWYAGMKSVENLQLIQEAAAGVQTFDFLGLVRSFDAARAACPGVSSWALANALLQWHLSHSDEEALGGDLAYWYGKKRGLNGISIQAAQQVIGAPGFGSDAQSLRPFEGLQEGFAKLA